MGSSLWGAGAQGVTEEGPFEAGIAILGPGPYKVDAYRKSWLHEWLAATHSHPLALWSPCLPHSHSCLCSLSSGSSI